MSRRMVLTLALVFLAACSADRPSPANLRAGERVAVAPVLNRTGDPLLLSGGSVGDELAAEARGALADRGLAVARDTSQAEAVLHLEIRRWQPDAPVHTTFVLADVAATLVDRASGKVIWQFERRTAPIPTPGVATLATAYEAAANDVISEIFAAFGG